MWSGSRETAWRRRYAPHLAAPLCDRLLPECLRRDPQRSEPLQTRQRPRQRQLHSACLFAVCFSEWRIRRCLWPVQMQQRDAAAWRGRGAQVALWAGDREADGGRRQPQLSPSHSGPWAAARTPAKQSSAHRVQQLNGTASEQCVRPTRIDAMGGLKRSQRQRKKRSEKRKRRD